MPHRPTPKSSFARYIGIDYSGAQVATASLPGLRVYMAYPSDPPVEVTPPPSPRKYWSRRGIAEWLEARLSEDIPTLVGIDHGFSFPVLYFEKYSLALDWPAFLEGFEQHRSDRSGDPAWKRLAENRTRTAKSVFRFNVHGTVAHSTHEGLPWLLYLRQRLRERIHFWPFDGWTVPPGRSVLAEVYPSLWSKTFPNLGRTQDQHDAWSIAEWMRQNDATGMLQTWFHPNLTPEERRIAEIEGWILGVV